MLEKKNINMLLILILILIYFFVFKKIFGIAGIDDNQKVNIEFNYSNEIELISITKDSFVLNDLKRDPFGHIKKINTKPKVNVKPAVAIKRNIVSKSNPKIKDTPWPKLSYHGFVQGTNNNSRLALLRIDNKLLRVRTNDIINENITIVKIESDSIIVKRYNKDRVIKK